MDEPMVAEEKKEKEEKHEKHGTSRLSLWVGLGVLLLGVLGQILISTVVPEEYLYGTTATYGHYQLIAAFTAVAETLTYLGVVWVGVFLARWGLGKKHC